uniref:FAST kinase domain-containing protein 4 n=1 Tax=Pogona vitticeps TaxID=103695 RepID=A0A6J0U5C0_9SAUR
MAANVIRRCCHLSRTPFPLGVQARTALAGGKVASTAGASSRLRLALLTTCHRSVQIGGLCAQEQTKRLPQDPGKVESLLHACSTTQELLSSVDLCSVNANQAAMIITRLSYMVNQKKREADDVRKDKRFKDLLKTVTKRVTLVTNTNLVALLKSLYLLGEPLGTEDFCVVEEEVRWRLHKLSYKNLVSLTELLTVDVLREKNRLLSELLKKLELRWTEIEDARSVVVLVTKMAYLSPTLKQRLEDKALEIADQFSLEDIWKVAMTLAHQNNRSIPLLRALSYYLVQKQLAISPNVLVDLVFAYAKLNFHQTQLFQKIAMELQPYIPEMTPNDVTRCVRSFAYLKWLNLPLFEAFMQYLLDNEKRLTPLHLSSIILSLAHLNFHPSNREAFYGMIHRGLENHLDSLDPDLLLDLVWSLCILQQANAAHLQRVLEPKFHLQFLSDQNTKRPNYLVKLIQINATARLECADYKGPFLAKEILGTKERQAKRMPTPLQTDLKEVLKSVAGNDAHVRFEVDLLSGWLLDAVMVLDAENQPLPVTDAVIPSLSQSKPLPPWPKRLAFLRWEFPNFSNRSKELLGRFAMARRHIQAAGFLVVDVPYYEWHDLKMEWQKAAYLRAKMSKAIAEEMAR